MLDWLSINAGLIAQVYIKLTATDGMRPAAA